MGRSSNRLNNFIPSPIAPPPPSPLPLSRPLLGEGGGGVWGGGKPQLTRPQVLPLALSLQLLSVRATGVFSLLVPEPFFSHPPPQSTSRQVGGSPLAALPCRSWEPQHEGSTSLPRARLPGPSYRRPTPRRQVSRAGLGRIYVRPLYGSAAYGQAPGGLILPSGATGPRGNQFAPRGYKLDPPRGAGRPREGSLCHELRGCRGNTFSSGITHLSGT